MAPVVMMGKDKTGTNGIFLDLSGYSSTHQMPSVKEVLASLEGGVSKLPFVLIKLNQSKIFFDIDHYDQADQQKMIRMASHARRNNALKEICREAVTIYCEYEKSSYVEESIFEGFPSFMERKFIDAFNSMAIDEKHESISLFKERLSSNRLLSIGKRIICSNYPQCYDSETVDSFHQWCLSRIYNDDDRVPWITFKKAGNKLSRLKLSHSSDPFIQARIREYESYLHNDLKHLIGYGRNKKVV